MKHLKTYEKSILDIHIGDFILVSKNSILWGFRHLNDYELLMEYLQNNIGEVDVVYSTDRIRVKYDIPQKLLKFFKYTNGIGYYIELDLYIISNISSRKEDLEAIITGYKYNI